MLTKISIENFKAIGDRVEIPIRPLTLLFGANSAGKSTILQALHYAREIIERQNLDPDKTISGGDFIDLGGFKNFAHNHNINKEVKIKFDLDLSNTDLLGNNPINEYLLPIPAGDKEKKREIDISNIGDEITSGWVELCIAYDEKPYVSQYSVGLDGELLASIKAEKNQIHMENINLNHALLSWPDELLYFKERFCCIVDYLYPPILPYNLKAYWGKLLDYSEITVNEAKKPTSKKNPEHRFEIEQLSSFDPETLRMAEIEGSEGYFSAIMGKRISDGFIVCHSLRFPKSYWEQDDAKLERKEFLEQIEKSKSRNIPIESQTDALPAMDSKLVLQYERPDYKDENLKDYENKINFLREILTRLIVGPGKALRDYLIKSRYIGPLRKKPQRNYEPPRYLDETRWSNGIAAWDVIYAAKDEFIKQVGNKLVELETGYTIQSEDSIIIPKNNFLLKLLATNEAFDLEADEIWLELNKFPTMRRIRLLPTETSLEDNIVYPYQVSPELMFLPQDVGEGVSQVFPIIVACLDSHKCFLAIEQPELHLHPRQQAGLGDILIAAKKNDKMLFIETHSEHLILRLLRRIRESASMENPPLIAAELSVIYVEQKDGKIELFNMEVDDKGEFLTPWPDSFFEQDFIERFAKDA